MSEFTNYLQQYMTEKQITTGQLAQETGIERTVLYRYLKGRRLPSNENTVEKIADALQMNVLQKQQLMEHYDRLILGDLTVNSFHYVKRLLGNLRNFGHPQKSRNMIQYTVQSLQREEQVLSLDSKEEIVDSVMKIFSYAAGLEKSNPTLYLWMQPDNELIQNYVLYYFERTRVSIEQIVCLEQNLSRRYENLNLIQNLLPICFGDLQYEVRYYYDYLSQHINDMSWMPNVIILEDYVLQFNYSMTQGILVHEATYAESMRMQYRKCKKQTAPFMVREKGITETAVTDFQGKLQNIRVLFREPGSVLWLSLDLLQEELYSCLQKNVWMQEVCTYFGEWRGKIFHSDRLCPNGSFYSFCKREDIQSFLETGVIPGFSMELNHPLDERTRIRIVERMIYLIKTGYIHFRFLPDEIELPQDICIIWNGETKQVSMYQMCKQKLCQVSIEESGFFRTFQCFMEYMEQKGMLPGSQETEQELERMCRELMSR